MHLHLCKTSACYWQDQSGSQMEIVVTHGSHAHWPVLRYMRPVLCHRKWSCHYFQFLIHIFMWKIYSDFRVAVLNDVEVFSVYHRRKGMPLSSLSVHWSRPITSEERTPNVMTEASPLGSFKSSSSSSSNHSDQNVSRTGSTPLAVPGRRWVI